MRLNANTARDCTATQGPCRMLYTGALLTDDACEEYGFIVPRRARGRVQS